MTKSIRSTVVLAATFVVACAMCFAQSGEAVYKAHCQSCHGTTGVPSPGIAKILGVPAANAPAVKKLTVAEMEAAVKNGKGKMKPISGLNEAQIKEVVEYFRTLGKK